MGTKSIAKAAVARVAQTAQKVNDPESCAAMTHLAAHPHICAASIMAFVSGVFFFVFKLFRRN